MMLLRFFLFWTLAWLAGTVRAEIVIILSDNKPSVMGVAQALRSQAGTRIETVNLGGDRAGAADKLAAVQASPAQQVVAIGLLAAQAARAHLSGKQVVFCQVLNYEDFDLTAPWMKGVSAIPSMQRQFQVWKALNPGLKRVGVLTSRQMWPAIEEAANEARAHNIELVHFEVGSDREVMPALRRATDIQGLWLAPDSRVLSTGVILEMLSYASRQNIQVLGFSPALLREGALLAGATDNNEIARLVLARLKQAQGMPTIPGEAVMPLASATISVNGGLAGRLGLSIPERIKAGVQLE